jgi:ABC-type polysaccharide/polyol phosphate export permease
MAAFIRLVKIIGQHRWLIVELVKREVKLRYRGTWLGFIWSMLNPLIMTGVYTLVFSFYLRIDIPKYAAFLVCALLPWNWFNEAISSGTNCLVDRPGFVRDAIFPSEVLPITAVGTAMINYVFSFPVLLIILLAFKVTLGWPLISLPVIMAVQFLFTLGLAYFLGMLNVFFRDLRYIVQLALLAVFFLTPIFYGFSSVPERFRIILKLNPMTHIINGYRQIFFYDGWPFWDNIGYVFIFSMMLIVLGSWAFESRRESFAEYL